MSKHGISICLTNWINCYTIDHQSVEIQIYTITRVQYDQLQSCIYIGVEKHAAIIKFILHWPLPIIYWNCISLLYIFRFSVFFLYNSYNYYHWHHSSNILKLPSLLQGCISTVWCGAASHARFDTQNSYALVNSYMVFLSRDYIYKAKNSISLTCQRKYSMHAAYNIIFTAWIHTFATLCIHLLIFKSQERLHRDPKVSHNYRIGYIIISL